MNKISEKEIRQKLLESYIDLHDYPPEQDFIVLIRSIHDAFKRNKSTTRIIDSITTLRIILKFHKELFFPLFDNIVDYFIMIFNSENYSLLISGLILLNDLFSHNYHDDKIKEWVIMFSNKLNKLSASINCDLQDEEIKQLSCLIYECFHKIKINYSALL